ncbi:ATP-binding cassette domain-containing protein [Paenibacillus sp. FSL K6-2859]|uniref:ATP-binding cassette domain-containing protein n=1 Tax=Paenibacillus sp. FSL K6-2859 TaxID=2921482 RepID=UPI0030FD10E4
MHISAILERITFAVKKGEAFGFLGPKGVGNTTTMCMMTGLLQSTSGEILINGMNISHHKKKFMLKLVLFSSFRIYTCVVLFEIIWTCSLICIG